MRLPIHRRCRSHAPARSFEIAVPGKLSSPRPRLVFVDLDAGLGDRALNGIVPNEVDVGDVVGHGNAGVDEDDGQALPIPLAVESDAQIGDAARLINTVRAGVQEVDTVHCVEVRSGGGHADRPRTGPESAPEKSACVQVARRSVTKAALRSDPLYEWVDEDPVATRIVDLLHGERRSSKPVGAAEETRERERLPRAPVVGDPVKRG